MPRANSFFSRHQRGSYVIWVLILIPVLVGGLALIFNAGSALATHERARTAADAAALAGAMAAKRESQNLISTDSKIKDAALERVYAAARYAAGDNNDFAHDGTKIDVSVEYPPISTIYSPYNDSAFNANYIGVKVSKKTDNLLAVKGTFGLFTPVSATAVARVGQGGADNTCPGIYVYGQGKKVTNLKGGSDFKVKEGGIFLNSSGSTALFGDSGTMTAQWIEILEGSKASASVTYYCDKYPLGSKYCVESVKSQREQPLLDLSSTPCSASNSKCSIVSGIFKCDCSLNIKGELDPATCKTGELPLKAGRYCGVKIHNSGSDSNPLRLSPSTSTNIWDFRGSTDTDPWGGIEILNSVVEGVKGNSYEGVVLFDNTAYRDPKNQNYLDKGFIMGEGGNNKSKATLKGFVRLYFNTIFMLEDSLVDITSFYEDGCGKLPDTPSVIVQ